MVGLGALAGLGAREDAGGLPDDLARVPAKAQAVFSVRVADLWGSELGQELRKAFGKDLDKPLEEMKKSLALTPADIERVTICMHNLHEVEDSVVLVRHATKFDTKKILSSATGLREMKVAGQTVHASRGGALFFSDDGKTFVAGTLPAVQKLLEEKPAKAPAGLALMLSKAAKHSVTGYVDPSPLAKMIAKLPPPLAPAKPLILANHGVAWADVGYTSKLRAKLTFKDEKEAARGRKVIDAVRALGSLTLSGLGESVAAKSKPLAALLPKVEKALDDASIEQKGSAVEAAFELAIDKVTAAGLIKEFMSQMKVAAARTQSTNNLKQIGLAFHNYHDQHGSLPPAAVYDKDGKALLSWRVLILPYIGQDELYKEFRLNEPWDSDHNKKLLAKIPPIYVMPSAKASAVGGTYYQGFLGKTAAFEGKRGLRFADFTDGLSNTILIAESAADVPWTKPADLPFDPDGKLPKLGGTSAGGFHALFGDGSVRFMKDTIKPEILKLLIMRNDGMVIPSYD
jgi:hypothetical protein